MRSSIRIFSVLFIAVITSSFSSPTITHRLLGGLNWQEVIQQRIRESEIGDYQARMVEACAIQSDLNPQFEQDIEVVALQSAYLAKLIVERLRNNVDLNGAVRDAFFRHYFVVCNSFLASMPSLSFFSASIIDEQLLNEHAKLLLEHALYLLKANPQSSSLGYIYSVQWLYHNLNDDHEAAAKSARMAMVKHSQAHHVIDISEKYSYLGTSLLQLGEFREALLYMRKGLVSTLNLKNSKKYADAHFGLAFAYLKVGDYDSAKRYFELFVQIETQTPLNQSINADNCQDFSLRAIKGLINLGKIDRVNGQYDDALHKHQCAVEVLKQHADYYYYVAVLELAKDLAKLARDDEAKAIAEHLVVEEKILDSHKLQALILIFSLELRQSPAYYNEILAQQIMTLLDVRQDSIKFPLEFIELSQLKMDYAAATNNLKAFTDNAKAGFTTIKKYRDKQGLNDAWLATQYAFVEHYINAIYANPAYTSQQQLEAILNVMDSYYALKYFDKPAERAKSDIQPDQLEQLIAQRKRAEKQLVSAIANNKQAQQIQLDDAKEALLASQRQGRLLDYQSNSDLEIQYSLSQIQKALQPDELLVRYFVSDKHRLAIVVSHADAFIRELPTVRDIRQNVAGLSVGLRHKNLVKLMKFDGFKALIPLKYIQQNQFKRLIIIPDDVLHKVPFSAIHVGNSNQRYQPLGNSIEIIRTHSIKDYFFAERKAERVAESNNQITIFADPAFTTEDAEPDSKINRLAQLERLPYTAQEAHLIKQAFSDHVVNLFMGTEVTNKHLMDRKARASKILHIATHGFFDPSIPDVVGIATYADPATAEQQTTGFLSLTELLEKPFYSELVVISGCETMLGKYYKGAGMKSFTRGILSKGAGSVIGTLWKVPDHSTSLFMRYFYTELIENQGDSAAALVAAKKQLSHSDDYYDPFYWAGFVLTSVSHQYQRLSLYVD